MKSYTPQIAWHNRDPVYTVDIQDKVETDAGEEGRSWYRVATAGSDRHVMLWKIQLNSDDDYTNRPRATVLCDLNRHEATINVVRFCPGASGHQMIASADDFGAILLWRLCLNGEDNTPANKENHSDDLPKSPIRETQSDDIEIVEESVKKSFDEEAMPDIFGDTTITNVEQWTYYKTLRGHLESVVDICWSPDGQYVISGSVDNTAYIWDVQKLTKLRIITAHKNWVQGVAYDPASQFLATICSDRVLRVFDGKGKKLIHQVDRADFTVDGDILVDCSANKERKSKLFYDYTFQSFCRRLNFSPGGEFLLVPSGIIEPTMQKSKKDSTKTVNSEQETPDKKNVANDEDNQADKENTSAINVCHLFMRSNLTTPAACYVTKNEMTVAAKCCPQRFSLRENCKNSLELPYRMIFAVITQKSVLLYDTQQATPVAFITDIHYSRLSDLSWSADGLLLMVTSEDGYCTFVTFEKDELGSIYDGPVLEIVTDTKKLEKKKLEERKLEEKKLEEKVAKTKIVNWLVPRKAKKVKKLES